MDRNSESSKERGGKGKESERESRDSRSEEKRYSRQHELESRNRDRSMRCNNPNWSVKRKRLFVGNLPGMITEKELLTHFETYGKVYDVHRITNYAFVQYGCEEDVDRAAERSQDLMFKGVSLTVRIATDDSPILPQTDRRLDVPLARSRDSRAKDRSRSPVRPSRRSRFDDDKVKDEREIDARGSRVLVKPPKGMIPALKDGIPLERPLYDCVIITPTEQQEAYCEELQQELKSLSMRVAIQVLREGESINHALDEAALHNIPFAISVGSQNAIRRSLTLNILHGIPQEHRNMPVANAYELIGQSFEEFVESVKMAKAAAARGEPRPTAAKVAPLIEEQRAPFVEEKRAPLVEERRAPRVEESHTSLVSPTGAGSRRPDGYSDMVAARGAPPASAGHYKVPGEKMVYVLHLLADGHALKESEILDVNDYVEYRMRMMGMVKVDEIDGAKDAASQRGPTQDTGRSPMTETKDIQARILNTIRSGPTSSFHNAPPAIPGSLYSTPAAGVPAGAINIAPPIAVGPPEVAAKMPTIDFDNPNVRKALDNLISSGPMLLNKLSSISSSAGFSNASALASAGSHHNQQGPAMVPPPPNSGMGQQGGGGLASGLLQTPPKQGQFHNDPNQQGGSLGQGGGGGPPQGRFEMQPQQQQQQAQAPHDFEEQAMDLGYGDDQEQVQFFSGNGPQGGGDGGKFGGYGASGGEFQGQRENNFQQGPDVPFNGQRPRGTGPGGRGGGNMNQRGGFGGPGADRHAGGRGGDGGRMNSRGNGPGPLAASGPSGSSGPPPRSGGPPEDRGQFQGRPGGPRPGAPRGRQFRNPMY